MRRVPLALTVAAAAVAVGCSLGRSERDPFASPGERASETLGIRVVNRNFNDATVHAVSSSSRIRLDLVPGNSNRSYTIAWRIGPGSIRAEIDLVGGGRFATRSITAAAGDVVTLHIEPRLQDSYLRR